MHWVHVRTVKDVRKICPNPFLLSVGKKQATVMMKKISDAFFSMKTSKSVPTWYEQPMKHLVQFQGQILHFLYYCQYWVSKQELWDSSAKSFWNTQMLLEGFLEPCVLLSHLLSSVKRVSTKFCLVPYLYPSADIPDLVWSAIKLSSLDPCTVVAYLAEKTYVQADMV